MASLGSNELNVGLANILLWKSDVSNWGILPELIHSVLEYFSFLFFVLSQCISPLQIGWGICINTCTMFVVCSSPGVFNRRLQPIRVWCLALSWQLCHILSFLVWQFVISSIRLVHSFTDSTPPCLILSLMLRIYLPPVFLWVQYCLLMLTSLESGLYSTS